MASPAAETNSIAALAFHTVGNAEENVIETLSGREAGRDRDQQALGPLLERDLGDPDDKRLSEPCNHPRRGSLTGREVLIVVARHSAEHLGQAELTRDLWNAGRTG
ncbi:MAG: hypothetical protein R3A46_10315 [Thermomicrobiales bacterium]